MKPTDDANHDQETFYCLYCSQTFKHKRSRDRHLKLVCILKLMRDN